MKKTLSILVIAMLILLIGMGSVNAATEFKMALSADNSRVKQGDSVVITVNLKDFTAGQTGIDTFSVTLDYDKTVFETVKAADIVGQSGWAGLQYNEANGQFVLQNSTFISENHVFAKITLKAKANATIGNTVVTLKDGEASDGLEDIAPADQKITLTITAASAGGNTTPTNTTPANTTPTNTGNSTTMPDTGVVDYVLPAIIVIAVIGIFSYVRYNRIDK